MGNDCERAYARETLKILEERRSCRKYTGEQISEEELEAILQAGNAAPIGMNRVEGIRMLVVQNKELLDELETNTRTLFAKMGMKKIAIYNAPTLIIIAVKKLEGAFEKGQYCSAACILENMIMAATEMRLGNVFLSGVTTALNTSPELLKRLGIPEGYEAAASMAVGRTEEVFLKRDLAKARIQIERL